MSNSRKAHQNLESSQGLNGICDHWGPPMISCQGMSSTHPAFPKWTSKMPTDELPRTLDWLLPLS